MSERSAGHTQGPGAVPLRGRWRPWIVAAVALVVCLGLAGVWIVPAWLESVTGQVPRHLVAGRQHTCMVTASRGVVCWGDNSRGQLGDATTLTRSGPIAVTGLADVTSLASGTGDHTCALVNGSVWCWGLNDRGQLGDGTTTSSSIPVNVTGVTTAVGLAAGARHSCAVLTDGHVRCWGANGVGELGDGSSNDSTTPVEVVGLPTAMSAVTSSAGSTCAVTRRGRVQCWGDNTDAQLGAGDTGPGLTARPARAVEPRVRTVAIGDTHACAISLTGSLTCWGANDAGQLGDGSTGFRLRPIGPPGLGGVTDVAAAAAHTCAVRGGGVLCWGTGRGRGGHDASTPVEVVASGVRAVALGGAHACALVDVGVECWGSNQSGQLGDGTTNDSTAPVRVAGL